MAVREPAAIRHKNPGAMWPGAIATKWGSTSWSYLNDGTGQGGNGKGNKIATFPSWTTGIAAQLDLWRTSPKYRNQPFSKAIATWSGGNHVEAYIQHVLKRIPGMRRDTIMNDAFWASSDGLTFLKVQAAHEAGKTIPATHAEWLAGQKLALSGASVKASPSPAKTAGKVAPGPVATGEAIRQGFPIGQALVIGVVVAVIGFIAYRIYQGRAQKALEKEIALAEATLAQAAQTSPEAPQPVVAPTGPPA
jgi:hypothetical protein